MESERRDAIDNIRNPFIQNMKREGILNKQLDKINNNKKQTDTTDDVSWCNLDCCFCFCFWLLY
jgi:hypothetical protein